MEDIQIREQFDADMSNAKEIEEDNKERVATFDNAKNSQYGKFKDAESLLSAYNNLQAEFTRKCQKLSEMVKANEQINNLSQSENSVVSTKTEDVEEVGNSVLNNNIDDKTYKFKSPNWNEKVVEFLKTNTLANDYKQEISNEILKDKDLQQNENCLDLAWARVVEKEFKPVKSILNDEEFVESQILSNEKIKQKIIENYITSISKQQAPKTISSFGGISSFAGVKNASSLSEAKDIVAEMFNVKGE